ncbi:NAD(P)/FAD-dependent oxidoreductase [Neisseria sp. N177_16]|nr:NAD(P)/FAD-dependent oxidoreductase [Neisseria sp. N177_16]
MSQNPHFCKSALARYTQWDFIDLVGRYGIVLCLISLKNYLIYFR